MDDDTNKKRGRGRPRKKIEEDGDEKKTRGRGRPKKSDETTDGISTQKKKGTRGRNKKPIVITAPPIDISDCKSSDEEDLIISIPISDLNLQSEVNDIDSVFMEHMSEQIPYPKFDENRKAHSVNIQELDNTKSEQEPEPSEIQVPLKYELFFPSDPENEIEETNDVVVKRNVKVKETDNFIGSIITERYGDPRENLFTKVSIYTLKQPLINDGTYMCWWCCHKFRGTVIPMPYEYNEPMEKYRNDYKIFPDGSRQWIGRKYIESCKPYFNVRGCFCSYNCAKAHNSKMTTDGKKSYRDSLVNFFYYKMSGDSVIKYIPEAPPKETLISFGGYLTINQFRTNMDTKFVILDEPRISQLQITIEESKHEQHTSVPLSLMKNKKHLRTSKRRGNSLAEFNNKKKPS